MTVPRLQDEVSRGPRYLRRPDLWTLGAALLAAIVLLPVAAVFVLAFFPRENVWPHLLATSLPRYLGNSLGLMLVVGSAAAAIGTGAAWLTTMTRFPLSRVLDWLLFAPLAVPAYIGAYALVDFLEYAGPVQSLLRGLFGWQSARDYAFPEIRSFWAAALVFSFGLYPYVYLLARAAFREQSGSALEVARALGCGPWGAFFRVALPLARPAIAIGAAVAMMEVLNDFGAVDYFAVQTLTTGIFSVWLEGGNAGGAAQIACVALLLVLGLLAAERRARARRRFHVVAKRQRPVEPQPLGRLAGAAACALCLVPVLAGFVLPVAVMLSHAGDRASVWTAPALAAAALNTLVLAASASLLAVGAAILMVWGVRHAPGRVLRALLPLTQIGYATPGAVIAVGILIPFAAFDHVVADAILALTGYDPGLIVTGSAAAIVLAYLVRFFAAAQGGVESGFGRVTPSMEMAARSLGRSPGGTLRAVHLPLARGSVLTAGIIVFVDAAKELPATLILRPFDFDTLATLTHVQASLESLGGAAPPALAIVVLGLLPAVLLRRTERQD